MHEEHSGIIDSDINLRIEECTDMMTKELFDSDFCRRLKNSCIYRTCVQFDSTQVMARYCACKAGTRIVGCCSHMAAAVWFLSYERHQVRIL